MSKDKQRLHLSRAQRDKFQHIRHLAQIQQLDPIEFEQFVGYLYQQLGHTVWMTTSSGDEGVDLILRKGRETMVVQCKQYNGSVGQPVVRDLYGALLHTRANWGVLATSGTISGPAAAWAQGKPIRLLDGYELLTMARQVQGRRGILASLPAISWPLVGLFFLALLVLALAGLSLSWAIYTIGQRTAAEDFPPPPTAVTTAPTDIPAEIPPTAEPTQALSPTVTLPGSQQEEGIAAVYRPEPPAIDARLDDWQGYPTIETPYVVAQASSWAGGQMANSLWRLAWNETHLYLAVTVLDDRHVQTHTDPKFAYLGDSLELQLDTSAGGQVGTRVTPNSWQFILSPGNFAAIPPGIYRFRGMADGNIVDAPGHLAQIAAVSTGEGYTVEAAIPWSDVAFTPAAGARLRAALSVNDNDTPGTAAQELMRSHVATRQWGNPSSWDFLTLLP